MGLRSNREALFEARRVGLLYAPTWGDPDDLRTLSGILVEELAIPGSGITAIIGPSGSGKSTLLSLLAGLRAPNVRSLNRDSRLALRSGVGPTVDLLDGRRPPPGAVGFVFQEAHLMKAQSAARNAGLAAALVRGAEPGEVLRAWAPQLHLGNINENRLVESLSGGQAQRIAVIRALATEPDIVVCDEPTSNLDEETAASVMRELRRYVDERGGAVVWVTHELAQAARYADRFLALANARVVGGEPDPVPLPETGHGRRLAMMKEALAEGSELPQLAAEDLPNMGYEIGPTFRQPSASDARIELNEEAVGFVGKPRPPFGAAAYLGALAAAEVFASVARLSRENSRPVRLATAAYAPFRHGFTWVLLLGLIVFYALGTAERAFDRHFDQSLANPAVRHIVFGSQGSDLPLNREGLADLERAIAATANEMHASLDIFGRRQELFAEIWPSPDGQCDAALPTGKTGAFLKIFDPGEPLYAETVVDDPTGQPSSLAASALAGNAVIATPSLIRRLDPEAMVPPVGFCLDVASPAYVTVAGWIDDIPGGGDLRFDIAMAERSYLSILLAADHLMKRDGRQRRVFPDFNEAALYFDHRDLRAIADAVARAETVPVLSGLRIDDGALPRLTGILRAATAAKATLFGLGVAFALAIGVAMALSVQAFFTRSEKSIAIMRAFGFRGPQVFVLLSVQVGILLGAALFAFMLLLAGTQLTIVPWLALGFGVPEHWLTAQVSVVAAATCLVAVVALGIAGTSLLLWLRRHRYVGPILQQL